MQKRFNHPFTLIPLSPREELVMKREPTPPIDLQNHAEFQYWMHFHIVTIRHCPLVRTPVQYVHDQYLWYGMERYIPYKFTVNLTGSA